MSKDALNDKMINQDNAAQASMDNVDDSNSAVEITPEMQAFYQRADAVIELANSQLSPTSHSGQVGASLLYAAARYSASVASIGFVKGDDLRKEKEDIIEFYTKQYRQMLSDNLDDYAQNFDKYVQLNAQS